MLTAQLSTWSLDPARGPIRLPPRPAALRHPDYEDRFDFTTVFCDIFWSADGRRVFLLGPPLLNLQADLAPRVTALPGGTRRALEIAHRSWVDLATVEPPAGTTGLAIDSAAGRLLVAPQPSLAHLFAGRRCIFTLNRNNDLTWIRDWALFHHRVHGCDAALVYDNGSDRYDNGELAAALGSVAPDFTALVIPWPFPYGVFDGRRELTLGIWDSSYGQTTALEHARLRCLGAARSVVNADIDEFVLCDDGTSIFEAVERSRTGYLNYDGWWIHAHPDARPPEPRRHRDFAHRRRDLGSDACVPKWAVAPARCPPDAQWLIHSIADMAPDEASLGVRFRHFRPINSNWDIDRNLSARKRTEATVTAADELTEDAPLRAALDAAFAQTEAWQMSPPADRTTAAYAARRQSAHAAASGDLAVAIREARAALARLPGHTGFALHLAGLLSQSGAEDEAAALRDAAETARRQDSAYRFQMGLSAELRGDLAEAEAQYRAATAVPSPAPEAFGLLVLLLLSQGRDAEARAIAQEFDRIAPPDRRAQTVAAQLWATLGHRTRAIACLERAAAAGEPHPGLLAALAHHLLEANQPDRAETAQRTAIARFEADRDRDRHPLPGEQVVWQFHPRTSRPELLEGLGNILQSQGRLNEAEAAFRESIRADPLSCTTRLLLAELLQAAGRTAAAETERAEAGRIALAMLSHPPDNMLSEHEHIIATANRLGHYADCLVRAGQPEPALAAMRELAARWPDDFPLQWRVGLSLLGARQYAEAEAGLRRVLAARPDHVDAHRELSVALFHQGRTEEAIELARRAMALDPEDARLPHHLGFILAAAGRWDEAAAAQARVLELVPDHAGALRELSGAQFHAGNGDAAIETARRAAALYPRDAMVHHHLGFLLAAVGDWAGASAEQQRVLALVPAHTDALRELSVALHHLGRNDRAIEAARRAIALTPRDARLHHHLGFLLSAAQRWREAEAAQRQALALAPGDIDTMRELSGILFHLDRQAEAVALARQALDQAPDDERLREHLDFIVANGPALDSDPASR